MGSGMLTALSNNSNPDAFTMLMHWARGESSLCLGMAEHRHLSDVVCMRTGKVRLAITFLPSCEHTGEDMHM